jgi:hypothetical protein
MRDMRPHFAIMARPDKPGDVVALNVRLSQAGITPIWITDFSQIQDILEMLAEPAVFEPVGPKPDHGVPFVGREKELKQIRKNLEKDRGIGRIGRAWVGANNHSPLLKTPDELLKKLVQPACPILFEKYSGQAVMSAMHSPGNE